MKCKCCKKKKEEVGENRWNLKVRNYCKQKVNPHYYDKAKLGSGFHLIHDDISSQIDYSKIIDRNGSKINN